MNFFTNFSSSALQHESGAFMCVMQSNVSLRCRLAEQLLHDLDPPDHHEVLLKIGSMPIEGRKTPQAEQNGLCSS